MSDYITLLGAETVSQAAASMVTSADRVSRAMSEFDFTCHRLEASMRGLSIEFSVAVDKLVAAIKEAKA